MELQRIVRAYAHIQPHFEEIRERIPLVCQKQAIVAQRRHRDPDLLQVEQVLQCGHFAQEDAMRDRVRGEERRREMVWVARFTAVRAEDEGIFARACH